MTQTQTLNNRQAADLTGVSIRRIQQLAHDADAPPRDGDAYPCKAFGEWLRRRAVAGLGVSDDGKVYDYDAERARLTHHQANKTALEEQVLRGDLITANEVERVWSGMIGAFRARMLSVPGRAAQSVIATADIKEAEQIIRVLVYEALSELADYDPEHYQPNRDKGQPANSAAAEPDNQPVGGRRKAPVKRGQRRARPVEH